MENPELNNSDLKRKKGKKQVIWKCEAIRKARVKGEKYENYKGKVVPSKTQGISCNCKRNCFELIPENSRIEIFKKFYEYDTKNEQDAYLQSLVECCEPKRKRVRLGTMAGKVKHHVATYKYSVTSSSGKYSVCKTGFLNLHSITENRLRRITSLLQAGKIPKDMRGKTKPGNSKPPNTVELIRSHIESFPYKIAHYTHREKKYLSEKLNVKIMHQLFMQKYPQEDVKYKYYLKVFHDNFDLTFGRPQVDACSKCEELSLKIKRPELNETAKMVATAEKMVHVRRSKKFFLKIKQLEEICREDSSIKAICIDYMQNLFLPQTPIQDSFYLHQLTVNVFNIHDLGSGKSVFYVYHQGVGKKGPDEVCSFIKNYIDLYVPSEVKHFHILSDGCPGQNKNHTMIRFCAALTELKRFETVNQYYPIRGHSFMPCDRNFAILKRNIRKHDRIFTMKQYVELIVSSTSKQKFTVHLMEDNAIIKNMKDWWPKYYKRNTLSQDSYGKNVSKEKKISFNISNYMQFTHNSGAKGQVIARCYIDGLQQTVFNLSSRSCQGFPNELAYPSGKVPIKAKNMENIKKFASYLDFGIEGVEEFYENIFSWPTTEYEETEDE